MPAVQVEGPYYEAGLAVSSPAVAENVTGTHCTNPRREIGSS